MKRKHVKDPIPYGADSPDGRKATRHMYPLVRDHGWTGTAFVKGSSGTVAIAHNSVTEPWRPVYFQFPGDGIVRLVAVARSGLKLQVLCEFRWTDLNRTMSREHLELVRVLANALYEQALAGSAAARVADLDLSAQRARQDSSRESARKRPRPKTDKVRLEIERLVKQGRDPHRNVRDIMRKVLTCPRFFEPVILWKWLGWVGDRWVDRAV